MPAKTRLAYEQLDLKKRQIRILRLLPSRSYRDPIKCVLYFACLGDKPRYEALSYAWGDSRACERIIVDEAPVSVTTNLVLALRRLRRRRYPRDLWVDAICINQNDNAEKSHQVNLMRDIYSLTAGAVLWLGDYLADRIVPLSREELSAESSRTSPVSHADSSTRVTRKKAAHAFDLLKRMSLNEHYPPEDASIDATLAQETMLALCDLMRLAWWSRAWTVQEAILPKRAALVYGAMKVSLQIFVRAVANSLEHHYNRCCFRGRTLDLFWDVGHSIDYIKSLGLGIGTFIDALNNFRWRQASDPRDHVFALLGLGGAQAIEANYGQSEKEVFIQSTRQLIMHSKDLYPLLRAAEKDRLSDLPTWVPDRSAEGGSVYIDSELSWLYSYKFYDAASGIEAETRETSTESVLELRGLLVDRIREVGDVLEIRDNKEEEREAIHQWELIVDRCCSGRSYGYPLGGTYDEAFWRVMTTDLIYDTTRYRRARQEDEAKCREQWSALKIDAQLPILDKLLFVTEKGMIGAGDRGLCVGDTVYILFGGRMPFVLRPNSVDGTHKEYIGQVYVHGIMDGEVLGDDRDPEWISLV